LPDYKSGYVRSGIANSAQPGFNVDRGEPGYMRTTLRSKGVDTEQEATAATVSDKVPHFIFGKKFRASLNQEKLERSAD
jgi:hypothetical protein